MQIYNSLSRLKEEFRPINSKKITMYTCGPTVYHYAHIGNLRSYIFEDVLEKSLNYLDYPVTRAMNITDVGHLSSDGDEGEDKMIKGAEREHKSVMDIAKFYTDAFKKDFERLNLKWPEIVIPATSCIDTYIEIISSLIDKGYAYLADGNVYFDISKLKEYYVLTNQSSDDMIVGARDDVSEDVHKRNAQDFVLWFTKSKFENQALRWESPWGTGYPGWHIECSGISYKYLGEYLDIHCGGVDNKFPHHTNEIAQSESYLGHKWCNYWFHVEHLITENGKMSKSAGGFTTVQSLIDAGYNPLVYKFFCLQSDYRKKLTFSFEGLDMAQNAYNKILKKVSALKDEGKELNNIEIEKLRNNFRDALGNDLNTASAIKVLFDVLKSEINDESKIYLIKDFDQVLGLSLFNAPVETSSDFDAGTIKMIEEKIAERANAKANKDYALADAIRNELLEQGIELIDTKNGVEYKRK